MVKCWYIDKDNDKEKTTLFFNEDKFYDWLSNVGGRILILETDRDFKSKNKGV
jgi:hypothetical protein